ncbi:neutral zinc metallopeptidase [Polluticoccus soli]|uniref:KPN_02809 family neutral zinc metallopeptidase n=1 Tax=Polluticoccus soli TaxID=3034150 RepID=UPI0023E0987D|nr:neutral zinc metallopeptidase [Flavipsychrobacter sp. JY13-12]
MLWKGRRESGNVEDQRGLGGGGKLLGGGIGAAVIGLIIYLLGGDPSAIMPQESAPQTQEGKAAEDEAAKFVSVVLADTEDVWNKLFSDMGKQYQEPVMVLFNGYVASACGNASSATGPFYCPLDHKLYIDLSFYNELKERFNAPGDFAMAYVVAHEVGHHVQNLLGISDQVQQMRQRVGEAEGNRLSVKLELQADFLAGVWAHHAQRMKNILESGDMEEALNAANAIGDDRLQQEAQGHVVPDAFTHGTSAQRMYWFKKGYDTGDLNQGDTFNAPDL